jgi:hypothetical protein
LKRSERVKQDQADSLLVSRFAYNFIQKSMDDYLMYPADSRHYDLAPVLSHGSGLQASIGIINLQAGSSNISSFLYDKSIG